MRIPLVNLLFISIVLVLFTSPVAAQTPVGYVLEIKGDWNLNGNTSSTLKRWQKLPPAGVISIKTSTLNDYIVIANLNGSGEIIDSRHCEVEDCSRPLKLPGSNPGRSLLRVALDTTVEFLFGAPDRYKRHGSRTFRGAMTEGVVRLNGGEIDYTPVIRQTGRYYLKWRERPRSGQPGKWSSPLSLTVERDRPPLIVVSDFKPGLYEINLQRVGGYETFSSAWVLVSNFSEYENAAASFNQMLALTETWGSKVEPDTSLQFLRAHLDYLAGQAH